MSVLPLNHVLRRDQGDPHSSSLHTLALTPCCAINVTQEPNPLVARTSCCGSSHLAGRTEIDDDNIIFLVAVYSSRRETNIVDHVATEPELDCRMIWRKMSHRGPVIALSSTKTAYVIQKLCAPTCSLPCQYPKGPAKGHAVHAHSHVHPISAVPETVELHRDPRRRSPSISSSSSLRQVLEPLTWRQVSLADCCRAFRQRTGVSKTCEQASVVTSTRAR